MVEDFYISSERQLIMCRSKFLASKFAPPPHFFGPVGDPVLCGVLSIFLLDKYPKVLCKSFYKAHKYTIKFKEEVERRRRRQGI